jgi:hypothetical protein
MNNWFSRNIRTRNLIGARYQKPSVVQLIGFGLIAIGVTYFLYVLFPNTNGTGESVSISFFLIMLGVSFAFPEMLKGQTKDMSTMRIVVFMMVNVVCMLLLKYGWEKQSFEQVHLDGYWVSIIAFLFGSKAAQSYFESKLAVPPATPPVQYTDSDYVNWAISQYQSFFYGKGNVRLLTHGKKLNSAGQLIDCVTIHLKDSSAQGIPPFLKVTPNGAPERMVETDVIEEVDKPKASYLAGDNTANAKTPAEMGNLACKLKLKDNTECLLTCSHVLTAGKWSNHNGFLNPTQQTDILKQQNGEWCYGVMDLEFDIALIKNFQSGQFNLPGNRTLGVPRSLTVDDIKKTKLTLFRRTDSYAANQAVTTAYLLNDKCINPVTVTYDSDHPLSNLVIISGSMSPPYVAPTLPGDSGSMVVDENNCPVAMVIAQNSKFTYAVSLPKVLSKVNGTMA